MKRTWRKIRKKSRCLIVDRTKRQIGRKRREKFSKRVARQIADGSDENVSNLIVAFPFVPSRGEFERVGSRRRDKI